MDITAKLPALTEKLLSGAKPDRDCQQRLARHARQRRAAQQDDLHA